MTRVYQKLIGPRMPRITGAGGGELVGWISSQAANVFLPDRTNLKACLLIGPYRGEAMMLNPVGGEAGSF